MTEPTPNDPPSTDAPPPRAANTIIETRRSYHLEFKSGKQWKRTNAFATTLERAVALCEQTNLRMPDDKWRVVEQTVYTESTARIVFTMPEGKP